MELGTSELIISIEKIKDYLIYDESKDYSITRLENDGSQDHIFIDVMALDQALEHPELLLDAYFKLKGIKNAKITVGDDTMEYIDISPEEYQFGRQGDVISNFRNNRNDLRRYAEIYLNSQSLI